MQSRLAAGSDGLRFLASVARPAIPAPNFSERNVAFQRAQDLLHRSLPEQPPIRAFARPSSMCRSPFIKHILQDSLAPSFDLRAPCVSHEQLRDKHELFQFFRPHRPRIR